MMRIQNKALAALDSQELQVLRDLREVQAGRSFDESVELFVTLCKAIVEAHYNRPDVETKWTIRLWSESAKNSRYVRVWKMADTQTAWVSNGGKSIYAFIDKVTGDVLKPATYKAPAKHPRGNVFDANPAAQCNFHGPEYLR